MGFQVVVMFIYSFMDDVTYVRDQKNCVCVFLVSQFHNYEGWNFKCGNYLFTTDTK